MQTLTQLEDQLLADPLGLHRAALLDQLAAAAAELGLQQRLPRTAVDYLQLEQRRQACLAAMQVITQVWHRQHTVPSRRR
ncbi:EscE/YscE/SsaE family type III secretion system needle protein co-chaperone [Chitinimonas sp. BJB300]|uniref:EscE/YscE/SsaE family type III secretion system needle protein co-chaperone n=1 Tax=Chitinimonas sp. BJB300 TaxID=1559339 RepID=UPI0013045C04|nr:EscE/YscE/SsaE family type III secretion system needle protein co-chaperone [Chitinimonas sp. BJB300]